MEVAALSRLGLIDPTEIVGLCERWLLENIDRDSPDIAWIAAQTHPTESEPAAPFKTALEGLVNEEPSLEHAVRTAVRLMPAPSGTG